MDSQHGYQEGQKCQLTLGYGIYRSHILTYMNGLKCVMNELYIILLLLPIYSSYNLAAQTCHPYEK